MIERPSDEAVELTANERELVGLLRREGRYSKVWFADQLLNAADLIERLAARAAIAAMQEQSEEAKRLSEYLGKPYDGGSDNHGS